MRVREKLIIMKEKSRRRYLDCKHLYWHCIEYGQTYQNGVLDLIFDKPDDRDHIITHYYTCFLQPDLKPDSHKDTSHENGNDVFLL